MWRKQSFLWQCLQTFSVVPTRQGQAGCYWHLVGPGQKPNTLQSAQECLPRPQGRVIRPQVSTVARLKGPALREQGLCGYQRRGQSILKISSATGEGDGLITTIITNNNNSSSSCYLLIEQLLCAMHFTHIVSHDATEAPLDRVKGTAGRAVRSPKVVESDGLGLWSPVMPR